MQSIEGDWLIVAEKVIEIDQEIKKIQDDLISDRDYNKLQNKFELNYINSNSCIIYSLFKSINEKSRK